MELLLLCTTTIASKATTIAIAIATTVTNKTTIQTKHYYYALKIKPMNFDFSIQEMISQNLDLIDLRKWNYSSDIEDQFEEIFILLDSLIAIEVGSYFEDQHQYIFAAKNLLNSAAANAAQETG